MVLRISGKNMDIGDALRERIDGRIEDAVTKFFDGGYSGHVTVEKTGSGFNCDCLINLDTGMSLQATGRENDAISSFDIAAERIEKRLRRYKRKLKDHHGKANSRSDAHYVVMEAPVEEDDIPENFVPITIAESSTHIRKQSVADAIMQLDLTDSPVVVFLNGSNDQVNVVYRRNDGNIGWIDPSRNSA